MDVGHYRTHCRRCASTVYDGPWIPPQQRHHLHQHHRTTCTAPTQAIEAPGLPALSLVAISHTQQLRATRAVDRAVLAPNISC